jgi:hypothetical protein
MITAVKKLSVIVNGFTDVVKMANLLKKQNQLTTVKDVAIVV